MLLQDFIIFWHTCHRRKFLLFFFWLAGLLLGICCSIPFSDSTHRILRSALETKVNPLSTFYVSLVPILVSSLLLWYPAFSFCCFFVMFEGICHSFCAMVISYAAGASSWIVRPLFLFSNACASALMWLLLIRYCNSKTSRFLRDVRSVLLLSCTTAVLDFVVIVPFLAELAKFY